MLTSPTLSGFRTAIFVLLSMTAFTISTQAQTTFALSGRVKYSTGLPASGATVTLTKTVYNVSPNEVSTDHATADADGQYSFQVEGRCSVTYEVQATASENVDGEALPPSNKSAFGGCMDSDITLGAIEIAAPHPITLGGVVSDQFATPVQGLTVTMTRTKYNLNPNVVTTTTTTTDGSGHYQFSTFSRCSIVEDFKASIGTYVFSADTATSGCVDDNNDHLNLTISFGIQENAGETSCNKGVGRPVNVANGNVYLEQTDFVLPGPGEAIAVIRSYNSSSFNVGLFGRGWTTLYDEKVSLTANNQLELTLSDGRTVSSLTPDFFGQIVRNGDGSYTVTFKDGGVHQFNSLGQLISLADRHGNQTILVYSNGRLSSITDPSGRVVAVTTNGDGRVLSLTDSMGLISTYTYGNSAELLSATYPDNSAYNFSYVAGPDGPVLGAIMDALGNIVERHDYDSQGRATSSEAGGGVEHYTLSYVSATETDVTDALGRMTKYFYKSVRGRRAVERVEGLCSCGGGSSQTQTWTYDDHLNVTSRTDALGRITSSTYDSSGNPLTITDPTGTVSYTYNQFAEVLSSEDQLNGVTTDTYDAQGNLLTTTNALGKITSFSYDQRGLLLTVTDARGKISGFAYDANGDLIARTDALAHNTHFVYDGRGRLTSATNTLGNITAFAYDALGRLKQVTQADGSTVSYDYDLAGRRTSTTDARGYRSTYAYDGANRLTSQTDAANQTTSYGYDAMSNMTSMTDARSRVTNYVYDDFDRLVKITYPPATAGATQLFETLTYDAAGNVTQRTDTAGRVTGNIFDNLNRVTNTTDADHKTTSFEYDALSRMTALVDALGQRYRFNYDAVGQLKHIRRGAAVMSFTYDAVGNRRHRTDYNGALTTYDYDALNRLKTVDYPDATVVAYTYDKLSRLQTATNKNGTVNFDYNKMNRLTGVTDVFGQLLGYNYDNNGNRTKLNINNTLIETYRYDAVNRLTKILDATGAAFTFDYDATNGLTQKKAPNGVKTTYQYDGLDRLTRMLDTKGATTVADHQYQFNAASQITQIAEPTNAGNYSYDALDRLTAAAYTNALQTSESYTYDSVGNRTSSHLSPSYGYQPFNRLAGTSSASYTYDTNGNLISKTDASGTVQYIWDFENRLTQVTLSNGSTVSYKYDALGRRIKRISSAGVSTNFVYDGQDVVKDLNSDGSTVDYINGLGIDQKLRLTDSRLTATGPLYFLQDHLGSTTTLTNSLGNSVAQITYDSFGNSTGNSSTRYDYTGRERDTDTGLMYYRARWYDPQLGRFISEDPIGLAGGINQFGYVGNNPRNATDPSGLHEIDVHYYLTYFLALKTGCFKGWEAHEIAHEDQRTDAGISRIPSRRR